MSDDKRPRSLSNLSTISDFSSPVSPTEKRVSHSSMPMIKFAIALGLCLGIWSIGPLFMSFWAYKTFHLIKFVSRSQTNAIVSIAKFMYNQHPIISLLYLWSWCETAFYIYYLRANRRLQRPHLLPGGKLNKQQRQDLFELVYSEMDHLPSFLTNWFPRGTHYDQLRLDNVMEWIAWAFFDSRLDEMTDQDREEALEMIDKVVKKTKSPPFPEGYNPDVRCHLLTFDPVHSVSRPLLYYMTSFFFDIIIEIYFGKYLGFKRYKMDRLNYWVYRTEKDDGKPPLFLVHGVGMGLISYAVFVSRLRKREPNRTIVCVLLPHVSMKLEEHVPSAQSIIKTVDKIYQKMKIDKATWIGHSLGTTWVAWMVKMRPQLLDQAIFIDPVCFALWEGSVANNFVYKNPLYATVTDVLMYFFASKELFISHTLSRHFIWFDNILFSQQVNRPKTHVFVAEKDTIINPRHTLRYLREHEIPHTFMRGLHHAQIFASPEAESMVIDVIE